MSVPPLAKDGAPVRSKAYALLDDPRVLGWGSIVLVLLAWELIARLFNVSALYLPRPSQIVVALVTLFGSGGLTYDLGVTLWRIFAGFVIALVSGTLLGLWIATSFRARAVADMFIAALYPLPKITLIPLLIIWLGTGGPFMLTISFLGAIFPIVINTVLGVSQCDPGLVLAARDLGAKPQQIMRRVLLAECDPVDLRGRAPRARCFDHTCGRSRNGGRKGRARRPALSCRANSGDRAGLCHTDCARDVGYHRDQSTGRGRRRARKLARRLRN